MYDVVPLCCKPLIKFYKSLYQHFGYLFLDKQAQGKDSKSGKNKGKTGKQQASASLHEHTDSGNNLIGGKQFFSPALVLKS